MEYRSPKVLSVITICGLAACLLLQLTLGLAGFIQILGPNVPLRGSGSSISIVIETFVSSIYFLAYLFSAVVFLVWLNRAYKNLEFLKPDVLEFSSGWAVGWWFVPIFSFFKPFQVVREVWSESDPDFDPDAPQFLSSSLHSAPAYMIAWWIAWIVMLVVKNVESGLVAGLIDSISTTNFGVIIFASAVVSIALPF